MTEDQLKKAYSELHKVNQSLKKISSLYYIRNDGMIYIKELVPFIETKAQLYEPEKVSCFYGALINPITFFDFAKQAKKSKLTAHYSEKHNTIKFGQEDNPDLKLKIQIANPTQSDEMIHQSVIPEMYTKMFSLVPPEYHPFENPSIYGFTTDEVDALVNKKMVSFVHETTNTPVMVTRQMALDVTTKDSMSVYPVCYQNIDEGTAKIYFMLQRETSLYQAKSLFATLAEPIH